MIKRDAWIALWFVVKRITKSTTPPPPPLPPYFIGQFLEEEKAIFGQNHDLIFGQATEKIFVQETSALERKLSGGGGGGHFIKRFVSVFH